MPNVVASISFFVNSGIRFVEETCKMRAFTAMWDRLCLERYGVTDPKARRFRYGVQVNSLGLTEAQPENNVPAHRARGARRHPVEAGPGPLDPAAGLERGARPAPSVGPAVVAPHPAGAGLRDRPARVRGHLRRVEGDRGEDRRARGGRPGRARRGARARRRLRGDRRAEGPAGPQQRRAGAAHRDRRPQGHRRQRVHRDRRLTARRRRQHPAGRPRARAASSSPTCTSGARTATPTR